MLERHGEASSGVDSQNDDRGPRKQGRTKRSIARWSRKVKGRASSNSRKAVRKTATDPAKKVVRKKGLASGLHSLDPRLERLTRVLLKNGAPKQGAPTIVGSLWPQHKADTIRKKPLFYKEPIAQIPLMTKREFVASLKKRNVPKKYIKMFTLVNVEFRHFNNKIYQGQIGVHRDLARSIVKIFKRIKNETDFRFTSVHPINLFGWNHSEEHNNTGALDWRLVKRIPGRPIEVSDHAFGAAIDLNPLLNPWVKVNSKTSNYDPTKQGTLTARSPIVKIFKEEGWRWGGDKHWKKSKDYQHFYRPDIPLKYFGKQEVQE